LDARGLRSLNVPRLRVNLIWPKIAGSFFYLKNGKAAGSDDLKPELLKYGAEVLTEPLHQVLPQI